MVQVANSSGEDAVWTDQGTVVVPSRTHRKTVVTKAVGGLQIPVGDTRYVRVISAEDAVPIKVEMEQPPPQLRIGT